MPLDSHLLHLVSDFLAPGLVVQDRPPHYWYVGQPGAGVAPRLPRTALVEAIAQGLMTQLAQQNPLHQQGKMYGVLLVALPDGEQRVLKAFSGLLAGAAQVAGWVPPIPGRAQVAWVEQSTLAELDRIRQEILALQHCAARQTYEEQTQQFAAGWQQLITAQRQAKQQRHQQRQALQANLTGTALARALEALDEASRQEGIQRRRFKRQRDVVLQPLQAIVQASDRQIADLKQQRKQLSRQLQDEFHAAYRLTNFIGQSRTLDELAAQQVGNVAFPTGTGECCAPKLLHYAAMHHLQPLALAEFWWGSGDDRSGRVAGQFYEACAERCQPILGFLLTGAEQPPASPAPLSILAEDESLIVVDKPAGLLSVPGRTGDRQDSVLSRLRHHLPAGATLLPVHRLDQDTSGILLLARDRESHRHLSRQFQQRQVRKVYEALLYGPVIPVQGTIALPLWSQPQNRPYQQVDWRNGKPSLTRFRCLASEPPHTRVEFQPLTGRTHQIRVHAAVGLGRAIVGDRLYGDPDSPTRLYLHAKELVVQHPRSHQPCCFRSRVPF